MITTRGTQVSSFSIAYSCMGWFWVLWIPFKVEKCETEVNNQHKLFTSLQSVTYNSQVTDSDQLILHQEFKENEHQGSSLAQSVSKKS